VSSGSEGAASASSATVADAAPHRRMVEDFVRAIETGTEPVCDGREGLRSVAVVEAVYEDAAAKGRGVP
jgi:predicted dehydrogenase